MGAEESPVYLWFAKYSVNFKKNSDGFESQK